MLTKSLRKPPPADPCAFVIFGASGDLVRRLLVPALYNLAAEGLLSEGFRIIGNGRREIPVKEFRAHLEEGLLEFATRAVDPKISDWLFSNLDYVHGNFDDPETYRRLGEALARAEEDGKTKGNRLFYCATPPTAFAPIGRHLGEAGLVREEEGGPWRRVIIEKPFGTDIDSARALNHELLRYLREHQIYRMDHYLGKETVQNILILRFANGLFEPIWNRNHIDHVQITVAEAVDVGTRGKFYDATGALRDMVPNHLFQLLSLVVMEPPTRFEANAVRAEKAEALDSIRVASLEEAMSASVRAQYTAGEVQDHSVTAYRDAENVAPDSVTETYVALRLDIDNWRWAGVPFYLRTGKAMCRRRTEIAIKFKQAPISMFRNMPIHTLGENWLIISIAPNEGIKIHFNAKTPGPEIEIAPVGMTFDYRDYFAASPATGYETLIYDCMTGDAILYQHADAVEAGWRAVEPFLKAWKKAGAEGLHFYPAGTPSPETADCLLARDGRDWRPLE